MIVKDKNSNTSLALSLQDQNSGDLLKSVEVSVQKIKIKKNP